MKTLGNIIWLIFGGLAMALGWYLIGIIAFITIIGIPWSKSCFVIGTFSLWPFGREVVSRETVTGKGDIGTGALGVIGNVIWAVIAGIWLALGHVFWALIFFITIVGIPFGFQHIKLAEISLMPIGKTVVKK